MRQDERVVMDRDEVWRAIDAERTSLAGLFDSLGEAEALDVAEGAPLMQVERTAYARSGEPLEFARDLFRGDRTRVVVWTSDLPEHI